MSQQLCEGHHRAIRHQVKSFKLEQTTGQSQWEGTMIGPRSDRIYGIFKNLRASWCTGGARVVGRTDLELWRFLLRRSIASWYRTSPSECLLATTGLLPAVTRILPGGREGRSLKSVFEKKQKFRLKRLILFEE